MKKTVVFFCFAMLALNCFSQTIENKNNFDKSYYLQKSKNQKTTAWVLLGTGALVDVIGLSVYPWSAGLFLSQKEKKREKTSLALVATGSAIMLGSIPFFISAKKNKRNVAKLSFRFEPVPGLEKSTIVFKNASTLNLKISL